MKELVISSHQKLEESKKLYKQSEELLLKELDLLDFVQSKEKVAIKTFSESLGESGRLDSEYYQPKYNQIIDAIKKIDYENLHNLVNLNKSIEPGSDAYQDMGIPFIRVSNLTKFGLSEPSIHLSENLFDNEVLEKLQPKKDTILLSKDGTVGIAYNIKKDTNIITSGAILHLTLKDNRVLPEYLTLVLNSLVVQMQSQRDAGGSIIKHWKPSEIGEVLIPIINNLIQTKIEEKIKESFKLKEESKQLLEVAKRAVEIAIEDSEDVAMEFIDEKV
ncbi:MAG TPA: restriction endonuclease subunit S [Flavobacteriaceae bacterium]|nr:restriction endonuclease subunit S [Flavobacteriaceae bacterium]